MLKLLIALGLTPLLLAQFSDVHQGFGLDIGSNGSGVFFSRQYTHESGKYSLSGELRFYDIKASDETIVYDWYYNQYQSVGGKSLLLVPFFLGSNYYPFAGMIANNFSPFVTFKSGPILTINGQESGRFINRWVNSETHGSWGGFAGVGAEIRTVSSTTIMLQMGYEYLPLAKISDGEKDYSGLLIHISFNRLKK